MTDLLAAAGLWWYTDIPRHWRAVELIELVVHTQASFTLFSPSGDRPIIARLSAEY
jgi:hypothetical protein